MNSWYEVFLGTKGKIPRKLKSSHFMDGLIILIAVLNILMKDNAYEDGVEMPFIFFHCQDSSQKIREIQVSHLCK